MGKHPVQIQAPEGFWPLSWPMGMTLLRLLVLPVFLWTILLDAGTAVRTHRWWAVGIFAVMAATDKLDGYLARRLHQTSHLGTILDPIADKLLIASATILLSFDWVAGSAYRIPRLVVVAIYGKDLIVASGALALLALQGKVTVTPRVGGRVSTVVQLSLVIATLIAVDLARLLGKAGAAGFLTFLWWAVGLISTAACLDYLWQGINQFRAQRHVVNARG